MTEKSDHLPKRTNAASPHEADLKIFYTLFNIEKNETIIHVFDCTCSAQRKKNFKGKLFVSEKGVYFYHQHFSVVMRNKYIKKVKKRFFAPDKFSIKVFKPELNKAQEYIFSSMDGDRDFIVSFIQQLRDNPEQFLDKQKQAKAKLSQEKESSHANIVSSPPTRLSSTKHHSPPHSSSSSLKKKNNVPESSRKEDTPQQQMRKTAITSSDEDNPVVGGGGKSKRFDDSEEDEETEDEDFVGGGNEGEDKNSNIIEVEKLRRKKKEKNYRHKDEDDEDFQTPYDEVYGDDDYDEDSEDLDDTTSRRKKKEEEFAEEHVVVVEEEEEEEKEGDDEDVEEEEEEEYDDEDEDERDVDFVDYDEISNPLDKIDETNSYKKNSSNLPIPEITSNSLPPQPPPPSASPSSSGSTISISKPTISSTVVVLGETQQKKMKKIKKIKKSNKKKTASLPMKDHYSYPSPEITLSKVLPTQQSSHNKKKMTPPTDPSVSGSSHHHKHRPIREEEEEEDEDEEEEEDSNEQKESLSVPVDRDVGRKKRRKRSGSRIKISPTKSFFLESEYQNLRDIPTSKYHFDSRTKDYNPKKLTDRTINISIQEFLKFVAEDDAFIERFHESRKDENLEMSRWERNNTERTYMRTSSVKMNVKIPFSSKTHQAIIDHMRLTVLKGGKTVIWEHSFEPSGFYGSDCLYLLGQVIITEVEKMKVRVVVGAGPVYIKHLNVLFKWKFNSVSMNILTDCFRMIDDQFSTYEREIREDMKNRIMQLQQQQQQQQQQQAQQQQRKKGRRGSGKSRRRRKSNSEDMDYEIPRVNRSLSPPPQQQQQQQQQQPVQLQQPQPQAAAEHQPQEEDDFFGGGQGGQGMGDGGGMMAGGMGGVNWEVVLTGLNQTVDFIRNNVSIQYFLMVIVLMILVSGYFRMRRVEADLWRVSETLAGVPQRSEIMELVQELEDGRIEFEKKWNVFQKDSIEMERNWNSFERRYLSFERNYLEKLEVFLDRYSENDGSRSEKKGKSEYDTCEYNECEGE